MDYCRSLIAELGYDEDELTDGRGLDDMTRSQVARLIDELRQEVGA